jgi:hypothetical protein
MQHALTIRIVALSVLILSVGVGATSFLGANGKAQDHAAQSHLKVAVQAVKAWVQDPYGGHGSYRSLDAAALVHEAPVVSSKVQVTVVAGGRAYCLSDVEARGHSAYYLGGGTGALEPGAGVVPYQVTLVHSPTADAASVCSGIS